MRGLVGLAQQVIRFIPSRTCEDTIVNFCFDANDYTIEEITNEINKYLTHQLTVNYSTIQLKGDWTKVPEIRHKFKLVRVYNLFEDKEVI